ncbi:helix-turn-helix domain-containing protein [Nitrospira sp. NS4]|uniref:helix-turn-helix domain-containing protein n=1 Tax=Nitrospira sp. NS4 TaxID=3414498 RepID=UPI003C2DDA70
MGLVHVRVRPGGERHKGARPAGECCTSLLSYALIVCSRESVSATLGQFRDQGLIRMDGRTMTIVNQPALSKLIG